MTFGTCLLFGGIQKDHQTYPIIFARTNAQLLIVSLISIVLPTAFATWSEDAHSEGDTSLVSVSHGSAIVLLLQFVSYTLFSYRTHSDAKDNNTKDNDTKDKDIRLGIVQAASTAITVALPPANRLKVLRAMAQDSHPRYPVYIDIVILLPSITAQIFTSLYILESIEASAKNLHLSHSFVGLVMIPLILSSVEHITAVIRSRKEGLAWVTNLVFGSCIRITLFVFPVAVLIGWIAGIPGVTMIFDGFQVTILALTILLVNHVIQNELLHW
jgi:Ca2+:H+ antiporter